jgi:hypothetical protein
MGQGTRGQGAMGKGQWIIDNRHRHRHCRDTNADRDWNPDRETDHGHEYGQEQLQRITYEKQER